MVAPVSLGVSERNQRLAEPGLMRAVEAAVKRRIQGDDAHDVLQATWTDVLQAADVPADPEEFRRFVFGVARHKVLDHYRRRAREVPTEAVAELEQPPEPLSARDILRWAKGELPDAESKNTLEWMLREGDGEKLEHIARDANLPAPRVRKRVSRLRRFLRQRWAAELLLGVLLASGVYLYTTRKPLDERAMPEPPREKTPQELARDLRQRAAGDCRVGDARACLDGLDRAKALDPAGDSEPSVLESRRVAAERLAPPKVAPPAPEPSSIAPPLPSPTSTSAKPRPATPPRPSRKTDVPSLNTDESSLLPPEASKPEASKPRKPDASPLRQAK